MEDALFKGNERSHKKKSKMEEMVDIEITTWEVRAYGIYARVCLFSRNERARNERVSFVKTNKRVRKYRTHALPMW